MKERALLDYFGEDNLKYMGYWDNCTNEYSSRLGTYRDALKNMTARNICTDTGIDTGTDIDTPLTLDTLSYAEQGALAKYLIETKSFDYFVEMTQTQYNYETYLGESLNELYSKTQEWLTTKTQTSR